MRTHALFHARPLLSALAGAVLLAGTTSAIAEDAHVNEMTFEVETGWNQAVINVTSSDGLKWDQIVPGQVGYWAHMHVDTRWPGYVEKAGIFLGACENTQCGNGFPRIFVEHINHRDYSRQKNSAFSTTDIPVSTTGIAVVPYGDQILSKCNEGHADASQAHSFNLPMTLSFTVNTRKDSAPHLPPVEVTDAPVSFNGGDHTRTGQILVAVNCLATSRTTVNPNPDPHRTKREVKKIDLFLTTFAQPASSQRGPSGTQCKPLKVTTRIETDKAGPINVKLWRRVNNGPITSEVKQMDAGALGGGKFGDDWNKIENVTQTTTFQYMAEVLGGTFAPETPWKDITIHCNGDFASPTSNANPDNSLPPAGSPKPNATRDPKVTTPPARVACIGGKVANGSCACPRTHVAVKKSATAFQCVKSPATEAAEDARRRRIDAMNDDGDDIVAPPRGRFVQPHLVGPGRPAPQRPLVGAVGNPQPRGPAFGRGVLR
jgi:hypothetical protein